MRKFNNGLFLCVIVLFATLMCSCISNDNVSEGDVSFEKANILTFKLYQGIHKDSIDSVSQTFKVINNSSKEIYNLNISVEATDEYGKIIGSGTEFMTGRIAAGKYGYINVDAGIEESDNIEKVKSLKVTDYRYYIGNTEYWINQKDENAMVYDYFPSGNEVDFDEYNILDIKIGKSGLSESNDDFYSAKLTFKNNSDREIDKYTDCDIALYDKDDNYLGTAVGGTDYDYVIKPNGSTKGEMAFECEDDIKNAISKYDIVSYSYSLTKDDDKGNNYYKINLINKTAEGSHENYW